MSSYSIRDLERLSGIKAHTLRIWEQRYHILRPLRSSTNVRQYSDDDLKKILNVSLLNSKGLKISSIARLSEQQLISEVNKHLMAGSHQSMQVDALVFCLLYLDEERFEQTLSHSIRQFGFEDTVEKIVFPFLRQLGDMWQVGLVTPAQEHYISNLIRQKLITGIDLVQKARPTGNRSFLFFLPENEWHELSLLYLQYLTKRAGHKCYYLGQSVPEGDLLSIAGTLRPDYLVGVMTNSQSREAVAELLDNCRQFLPQAQVLLSGRLFFGPGSQEGLLPPENAFKDFADFRKILAVAESAV